jgi:hypothetical protein
MAKENILVQQRRYCTETTVKSFCANIIKKKHSNIKTLFFILVSGFRVIFSLQIEFRDF